MTADLSVVIPVFNGAEHLGEQLDALVSQVDAPAFEVMICDNGSTDRSVAVARSFASQLEVQVVDASARRGQTHARNVGARAASSDRLVFLDQDDRADPGYLAAMYRALDEHPMVAARMAKEQLNPDGLSAVRDLAQETGLGRSPAPWAYGCSLGFQRATFEQLGGFDEELYVSGEDVELCWRAAEHGIALVFVSDAVLHYRFPNSGGALFRQGRRYGIGHERMLARHGAPGSRWSCMPGSFLGPLALLARAAGHDRLRQRQRALFLLGRRVGTVQGHLWASRHTPTLAATIPRAPSAGPHRPNEGGREMVS